MIASNTLIRCRKRPELLEYMANVTDKRVATIPNACILRGPKHPWVHHRCLAQLERSHSETTPLTASAA